MAGVENISENTRTRDKLNTFSEKIREKLERCQ